MSQQDRNRTAGGTAKSIPWPIQDRRIENHFPHFPVVETAMTAACNSRQRLET
jgi:hypothetical protein